MYSTSGELRKGPKRHLSSPAFRSVKRTREGTPLGEIQPNYEEEDPEETQVDAIDGRKPSPSNVTGTTIAGPSSYLAKLVETTKIANTSEGEEVLFSEPQNDFKPVDIDTGNLTSKQPIQVDLTSLTRFVKSPPEDLTQEPVAMSDPESEEETGSNQDEEWDEWVSRSYHSGDSDEFEMDHRPIMERTAVKRDILRLYATFHGLRYDEDDYAYKVVDRLGEGMLLYSIVH